MQVSDDFVHQVRNALTHLYDPDVLRSHPLIARLQLNRRPLPHAALRDTLIAAIEALQPAASVPLDSREWRVYKLLQLRYVQQMEQEQVAYQLGVGVRHLRREQRAAVEVLAQTLVPDMPAQSTAQSEPRPAVQSWESELSWLRTSDAEASASLTETLQTAIKLVMPLAEKCGVQLQWQPMDETEAVVVQEAALRQCLVSLTTFAIGQASGGAVRFVLQPALADVQLVITVAHPVRRAGSSAAEEASLLAARSLLGDLGNCLQVAPDEETLSIYLRLPLLDVQSILMIDDNAEVAQLFKRYLYGTRFRLQHVLAGEHVFELVQQQNVRLILLDVMMPGNDGWEILGALKSHPLTNHVPIVVCTVLPERELALALGAADFLAKPVLRPQLLACLQNVLARDG